MSRDIKAHLKENQSVKVKVISVDDKGKISLSIKRALDPKQRMPVQVIPQI
jgi:S1 RNA binding domain protein